MRQVIYGEGLCPVLYIWLYLCGFLFRIEYFIAIRTIFKSLYLQHITVKFIFYLYITNRQIYITPTAPNSNLFQSPKSIPVQIQPLDVLSTYPTISLSYISSVIYNIYNYFTYISHHKYPASLNIKT